MSKSYTNKDNEVITLSKEHLDRAVEMYDELAKLSPSRRVSWAKLSKMMESEGFDGSESSENYRQAIKNARRARGTLPTVESYADMLSDEKKDAIKREIGEISFSKQDAQDTFNRLNRLKREYSRDILMVEAVNEALGDIDWSTINLPQYKPRHTGDKTLLVTLNDLHYGYDVEGFSTIESVKETLNRYADRVIKLGINDGVSEIIVANLGDTIENKLHSQSAIDSKKSAPQQMVEASYAIISFLAKLSEGFDVKYYVCKGNHDRVNSRYKENLDGESYIDINKAMVDMFFMDFDNVNRIDTDSPYYHTLDIKGHKLYTAHGHRVKAKDTNLLATLSANYDTLFDIVLTGHLHSTSIVEVGENKFQIITGSLKGYDTFSEKINKKSGKNQIGLIFDESHVDIRVINID